MPDRHFVKYTFLKVDPAWRRLDVEERRRDKREFVAACEDFAQIEGHLLRSFSLVGTRGDCDLMLLSQSRNLDHVHEFHVLLAQSGLMKWSSIPYSYLAMTKPSEYSDESRLEVRPPHGKYLFVYPFVKTRAWYLLPFDERQKMMDVHIEIGHRFPTVKLNTTYSFGLDDQEFVVAFETDHPEHFLDLVMQLREARSSEFTLRDTPIFSCIAGEPLSVLEATG
jgi:chlorite dismutase